MFRPRQIVPMLVAAMAFALVGPIAARAQDKPATPQPPAAAAPNPPGAAPASPKSTQSTDPFGEEVALTAKTVVYFKGSGNWDSAFETIVDAFKSVNGFLSTAGIKPAGSPMTIYTSTDDTGFQFQAAVPIAE